MGKTVWGIVTWEDVDPRTKWFSIYVEGLTNAYRWTDDRRASSPGPISARNRRSAKGGGWQRKILKLNFWRPSDEYYENEKKSATGSRDGLTTSGFIGRNEGFSLAAG